jgi:hypothetical protein
MGNRDWKSAFGPTPEAFKQNVSFTLKKVKEDKPVKKIKTATVVAMAMIVLLLAAVAYAASTQWGVFSFFEYRYDKQMPPEAKNALQTNVPQIGGEEADVAFKVREALYDGNQLHVIIEARPKDAGKIFLLGFDQMPGDLVSNAGPLYEGDTRTFAQAAAEEGKSLINIGMGIKANDKHVDGSADCLVEEDGTLVINLSGPLSVQGDTVPLVCVYSISKWTDERPVAGQTVSGQFTFELTSDTNRTQKQFSRPAAIEKTGVTVDKILLTKTDAGVYAELTFTILPDASEAEAATARGGLWFEYLDDKGQRIELGTSSQGSIDGATLPNGKKSDTQFVQMESLDLIELPDSVTVRGFDCMEKTRFGQHTFTADK